jgi:hypothetical protein
MAHRIGDLLGIPRVVIAVAARRDRDPEPPGIFDDLPDLRTGESEDPLELARDDEPAVMRPDP